jgi:arsenate reductase (thioredoxin)
MNQNPMIVFVCEHGAAKSILAAAHFNKMARENNLSLTAIARGTHPDAELSAKTVAGLRADGLTPTESIPTKLDWKELQLAQRVVSFCTLPEEYPQKARVEYWDNVPPVSEDYKRARDIIVDHLKELLNHL